MRAAVIMLTPICRHFHQPHPLPSQNVLLLLKPASNNLMETSAARSPPRNTALSSLAAFSRKHLVPPTPGSSYSSAGPIPASGILTAADPYTSTSPRERVAIHLEAMDPQSSRFNGLKRSLNLKAIPSRRTPVSYETNR